MKDINNNLLKINDTVVYLKGKNSNATLAIGKIKKFYKDKYGNDQCTVDSQTHIMSSRILKLESVSQNSQLKYFEIHVTYDQKHDGDGYSIFIKAEETTDTIVDYARKNLIFEDENDYKFVDYIDELTEEEYLKFAR